LPITIARETAGAARIRLSLRPLVLLGGNRTQTSGASRREIAKLRLSMALLFENSHREIHCARMRAIPCRHRGQSTPQKENARGERAFSVVNLG
jgi:hypothetical protein